MVFRQIDCSKNMLLFVGGGCGGELVCVLYLGMLLQEAELMMIRPGSPELCSVPS